jgi:hypothetical protein
LGPEYGNDGELSTELAAYPANLSSIHADSRAMRARSPVLNWIAGRPCRRAVDGATPYDNLPLLCKCRARSNSGHESAVEGAERQTITTRLPAGAGHVPAVGDDYSARIARAHPFATFARAGEFRDEPAIQLRHEAWPRATSAQLLVSITADASSRRRRRHRNTHPNGGIGASTTEVHFDGSKPLPRSLCRSLRVARAGDRRRL